MGRSVESGGVVVVWYGFGGGGGVSSSGSGAGSVLGAVWKRFVNCGVSGELSLKAGACQTRSQV